MLMTACGTVIRIPPEEPGALADIAYPGETELGDDLRIIVTRHRNHLTLRNAGPHRIGPAHLWINRAYVTAIPGVEVGAASTVSLDVFRNRHGEPFPRGTLLVPERDQPIVLAEFYDPSTALRHRLIVRLGRD